MTNHYRSGATFEREVRAALESDGYDVIRSAGSKGKVDLVAIKPGQLLFIQCKVNGLCPPAERAELLRVAVRGDAIPLVAYKGAEGRRRPIRYRELLGQGPKQFAEWKPDEVHEVVESCEEQMIRNAAGEMVVHECTCGFRYAETATQKRDAT